MVIMNTSDVIALLAFVLSVASGVYTICVHRKEVERQKKQATLDAFNALQEQVLDELSVHRRIEFTQIAINRKKKEYKEQYDHIRTLLARIEHFSIGVREGIYDLDTVDALASEHLVFLYRKVQPIIEAAQVSTVNEKSYSAFGELADSLQKKHPDVEEWKNQNPGREESENVQIYD